MLRGGVRKKGKPVDISAAEKPVDVAVQEVSGYFHKKRCIAIGWLTLNRFPPA